MNVGLFYLRQLFFANFDLQVHTDKGPFVRLRCGVGLPLMTARTEAKDYTKLWNELREQISFVRGDKPCPGQGTFGHIAGGYDAGYYGCVSSSLPLSSSSPWAFLQVHVLRSLRRRHVRDGVQARSAGPSARPAVSR